jgi:histone H3/H4
MKKRERRILCNQIRYVRDPCIARLGRRVCVKRIAKPVYDTVRASARKFLKEMLSNAIQYTEYRWRKSITWEDVRDAVQYMGV